MRKEVMGQGKQSEQSSSESRVADGTQNSDVSSGDQKDQQVRAYFVAWYMVLFQQVKSTLTQLITGINLTGVS